MISTLKFFFDGGGDRRWSSLQIAKVSKRDYEGEGGGGRVGGGV